MFNPPDDGLYERGDPQEPAFSPESMLDPRHLDNVFVYSLNGDLFSYLSALGLGSSNSMAAVRACLDQAYPTLVDETDKLFQLMEKELLQCTLGGMSRVLADEDADGFRLSMTEEQHKVQRMELLLRVRLARLRLQERIE